MAGFPAMRWYMNILPDQLPSPPRGGGGAGANMTAYRKKLIEVALPLDAINRESAREKSIRHGHPSTLHLWWARRPPPSFPPPPPARRPRRGGGGGGENGS